MSPAPPSGRGSEDFLSRLPADIARLLREQPLPSPGREPDGESLLGLQLWVPRGSLSALEALLDWSGDAPWAHRLLSEHLSFPAPIALLERVRRHHPSALPNYLEPPRMDAAGVRWLAEETLASLWQMAEAASAPHHREALALSQSLLRHLGRHPEAPESTRQELLRALLPRNPSSGEATPPRLARDAWARGILPFWALSSADLQAVADKVGLTDALMTSRLAVQETTPEWSARILLALAEEQAPEMKRQVLLYLRQNAQLEHAGVREALVRTGMAVPLLAALRFAENEAERDRTFRLLLEASPTEAADALLVYSSYPPERLSHAQQAALLSGAAPVQRLDLIRLFARPRTQGASPPRTR